MSPKATPSKLPPAGKYESRLLQSLLPSSMASLVVHGLILLVMFQAVRSCDQGVPSDAGGEQFHTIGLTTLSDPADRQTDRNTPPSEDDLPPQEGETQPTPNVDSAVPDQLPNVNELLNHSQTPTQGDTIELPEVIGAGSPLPGLSNPRQQQILPGGGGVTGGSPNPGPNATSFENIVDSGTRFVYLIDISGSMSNGGRLGRALTQLKGSLRMLEAHQQFQVIFYGDHPIRIRLGGLKPRNLYPANVQNISLAMKAIDNVILDRGTKHLPALEAGLKLNPDVIYFLTDGQDASHTSGEMDRLLKRSQSGARIHVIEFATGAPETRGKTWLHQLAEDTGGKYRRVQL